MAQVFDSLRITRDAFRYTRADPPLIPCAAEFTQPCHFPTKGSIGHPEPSGEFGTRPATDSSGGSLA